MLLMIGKLFLLKVVWILWGGDICGSLVLEYLVSFLVVYFLGSYFVKVFMYWCVWRYIV